MRRFGTLLTLILGLGVGTVLAVPASPNADQGKITQLITKLGSDNFREREAANKELDSIGEPALEALRKAGIAMVVASDANPGTAPGESLPLAMALAVPMLTHAVAPAVSAGNHHSVALRTDGTVRTWGDDSSGELGLGRTLAAGAPAIVRGLVEAHGGQVGVRNTVHGCRFEVRLPALS